MKAGDDVLEGQIASPRGRRRSQEAQGVEVGKVRQTDREIDEQRGQTDRLEPGWGREDIMKARESGPR